MPRTLKKIKDPANEQILFNQNFDDISLDLADRSGAFSTLATAGPLTATSGQTKAVTVDVDDLRNIYTEGKAPIIPRVSVYIDTYSNSFRWPDGGSLSAAQKNSITVVVLSPQSVISGDEFTKAQFVIAMQNFDSASHDFYLEVDAFYVPAPETGIANRS